MKINYLESALDALESVSANKLRSGLTILGIVIGVAAVIAMLAIGTGTQQSITSQIESIGANQLFVFPGGDASIPENLTLEDGEAIAKLSSVMNVAAIVQGSFTVSTSEESVSNSVYGITANYIEVQNVSIADGSGITQAQIDDNATVAIIGSETADDLFSTAEGLVGKSIRVNSKPFTIIGVLAEEGSTGFGSSDSRVLVPFSTFKAYLNRGDAMDAVSQLYVQATSSAEVSKAEEEVARTLRSRHFSNLGEDDFRIMNTQDMVEVVTSVTDTMTLFLGGIAGISLLVGGIGIMNIMLVSVIERTKEIGLRKAMGARKMDILIQFLVESLILSLTGGFLGIIVGWGISQLVSKIAASSGSTLNPMVSLNSILLATIFSASVGVFFGLYPANRAANLQPVEALRTE
jgi:putative ABC transport system permease protein